MRANAARLFVDSGAWIALRSRRDQHHVEADRAFRTAIERKMPLFTTNLVIAEVHRLTLYRVGADAAARVLDRIEASSSVTLVHADNRDHQHALEWIERPGSKPVTYTDAVSFAVMERMGCRQVLGFDRDFEAAGFQRFTAPA